MNEYISEWKTISKNSIDVFGGKCESMEIAKNIVNRAFQKIEE